MKSWRAYFVVAMLVVAGFCVNTPSKVLASATPAEVQGIREDCKTFGTIHETFLNRCLAMVDSVASRLANDPDVNKFQLKRYVYTGIPGATIPDQQGFVPMLTAIINGGGSGDLASKAKIALAQANQILANSITAEELAAGVITQAQADERYRNTQNAQQTQVATEMGMRAKKNCTFFSVSPVLDCLDAGLTWIVKDILLEFVGFGLWASANLLNYAMYHGIFFFKDFLPDDIYKLWLVIRQAISLFVFFAGLYVGFMAIIGKSEEFKRYMIFLIIFGLFVNFSYPIVRVFVDISNVISLQVYQTTMGSAVLSDSSENSAGSIIMAKMGLQKLVTDATAANPGGTFKFTDQIASLPGALAAIGFVGYAAYIFFMAAFLIIMRTALLVCILAASPILLVDTIVPGLGNAAKWLRTTFLSQLFVAPVFALMLALTIKFLDVFSPTNAMNTANTNSVAVFFNLVMMTVMLHIMLKVTKAVAGEAGQAITKFAGKAGGLGTGVAVGAGLGIAGFAGRKTLGAWGEQLSKQGGIVGDIGRKMAGAKYDLRNLGFVQSGAAALGVSGIGQGAKKSNKEANKEYTEEVIKNAQSINDDDERERYLSRKLDRKWTNLGMGWEPGQKAAKNFAREEDLVLKQYIAADEERRKEMMDDDKNKRFRQRFAKIDGKDTTGMSEDVKKAYSEKEMKNQAKDIRNNDRTVGYFTADQATRESMYANALAANDKKAMEQLTLMNDLLEKFENNQITAADLASIQDQNLVQKILSKQTDYNNEKQAKEAQAQAAEAKRMADETIRQAQLSAAQAQAQAAQNQADATRNVNAAITQLAQSQVDTNQNLKDLGQGVKDLQQTLKTLIPTP